MTHFRPIPLSSGWKVVLNNYFDFNGKMVVDWNDPLRTELNATMLGLQFEEGFILDVGWKPEADITGHYHLSLLSSDWETSYFEFTTKDLIELENCMFPILSMQKEELLEVLMNSSINDKALREIPLLITNYLFSGWQMDLNKIYIGLPLLEKAIVFRCSHKKKQIALEVETGVENNYAIKLKYKAILVTEYWYKDVSTIRQEINRFMMYYLDNLLTQNVKGALECYSR